MKSQSLLLALGAVLIALTSNQVSSAGDFVASNTIPGYVHSNGAGSRVDVRTDGTYASSSWTVLFTRSLLTGDTTEDIQFTAGNTYAFQVATWNNAGGSSHNMSDASTVFTMGIPATPGPLVISSVPTILTSLTGSFLSSGEIQLTAVWTDATQDDKRKLWTFNGTTWDQSSENEDRIALIWDMQNDNFVSSGKCAAMCHTPLMYTAPGTFTDTWHWKATRTNPSGFADDKYWDDGSSGTVSGRRSDSGSAVFADNSVGNPLTYMAEGDAGTNSRFLFDFPKGTRESAAYAPGSWTAGDTLPGYVYRRGSGSRVDVHADGVHDGTGWSVTFRRKLDTGDTTGDIKFSKGGTYYFQFAVWDDAGGIAHDVSTQNYFYMMTIPSSPGALGFSCDAPGPLGAVSGDLLSSDELEITITWTDATRSDHRKQWSTADGVSWVQSSDNEDRIALIWDMQNDAFQSSGTCATMCHAPFMYTAPGTSVDTWHWKASRTGPTGYVDDKHWDDGLGGTVSGRLADAGTSVFKDNAPSSSLPTYMSSAGAGTSSTFLFEHAPATGWGRSVNFATPSTVKKAVLKVNFKKSSKDSFKFSGKYQDEFAAGLSNGLMGTFKAGTFTKTFNIGAKGKSAKDPKISVKITENKQKWSVSIKKSDLAAAVGAQNATIPKPGVPLPIAWSLAISNGWEINGTVILTYTAKAGKNGKGKL